MTAPIFFACGTWPKCFRVDWCDIDSRRETFSYVIILQVI